MDNRSLSQAEALRAAGLQVLFSLRQEAMQATLHDLQEDLAEARSTSPSPALEAAPWSRAGLQSAVLPSVTDENLFKAHLAARTAMHMAGRVLAEGVTGYSLAGAIHADLHALALDGWKGLSLDHLKEAAPNV